MALEGRGTNYSRARGVMEWALAHVYREGWAAAAAHALRVDGRLRVVEHRVRVRSGDRALRIAFASDFHAGPTTSPRQLDAAFAAIADAEPDVLLLGGDYVFLSSRHIGEVANRLRAIRPPLGTFAVLGNHDLWADDAAIVRVLQDAGVRVLVNEHARLGEPFERVAIYGVDDPWTGSRSGAAAFEGGAPDDVRILLAHAPAALLDIGDAPFDLALCGHTHGGHIALPGGIPIVAPGPLSRRYSHGRFDLGHGRTLIVSRGIGATESPIRWNADPDVLAIELLV